MNYDLKKAEEVAWIVGLTFLFTLGSAYVQATDVTNWGLWLNSALLASSRAAIAILLIYVGKLLVALKGSS